MCRWCRRANWEAKHFQKLQAALTYFTHGILHKRDRTFSRSLHLQSARLQWREQTDVSVDFKWPDRLPLPACLWLCFYSPAALGEKQISSPVFISEVGKGKLLGWVQCKCRAGGHAWACQKKIIHVIITLCLNNNFKVMIRRVYFLFFHQNNISEWICSWSVIFVSYVKNY